MFGSGIYLGGPSKASGYMSVSSGKHYMVEVLAALGKIKEEPKDVKHRLDELLASGYHSVAGLAGKTVGTFGPLQHTEYIVYSPSQVLPRRVFEYEVVVPKPTEKDKVGCQILRESDTPVAPGSKAFSDLLTTVECGKSTLTFVETEYIKGDHTVTVAVCPDCIKRLRLKKGDRIWIKASYVWGAGKRPTEVRVKKMRSE
jgi:hypothetical protein